MQLLHTYTPKHTHAYSTDIHIHLHTPTLTLAHSPYWHLHGWSHNQASTGTCCTWRFPGGLLSPFSSPGGPSSGISALSPHTFHSSSEAEHTHTVHILPTVTHIQTRNTITQADSHWSMRLTNYTHLFLILVSTQYWKNPCAFNSYQPTQPLLFLLPFWFSVAPKIDQGHWKQRKLVKLKRGFTP